MALSQFSSIDEYGFQRNRNFDVENYENFYSTYLNILISSDRKWSNFLKRNHNLKRSQKLKSLIRHGVPSSHRSYVWFTVSGALDCRNKNGNRFSTLLDSVQNDSNSNSNHRSVQNIIKDDLSRTFPDNIRFNTPDARFDDRQKLFNVLAAYAQDNEQIGYCQGMNYIAGTLLLITAEEDSTFWLLKTLLEKILPPYYTRTLSGLVVDTEVLSELVRMKFPDVHSHFKKMDVQWPIICTKWFICLYIDIFPFETVLRIWDCLFYEGSKILFRVALTIIGKFETRILECQNTAETIKCFEEISKSSYALNCHQFLKDMFRIPGSLPIKLIERLRHEVSSKKKL